MRAVMHRRTTPHAPDAGFTLVETMVAIGLIGVVMTALGTFFVSAMRTTTKQTGTQAAVQVADDAMERVRSLRASKLGDGRDQASSTDQWVSPVAGASQWLTGMTMAYDAKAAVGDGANAPMPTSPLTVTLSGVPYKQHFYLGRCWQVGQGNGGNCTTSNPSGAVEFYRVVVAVTWPDSGCATGTCSYVTASLFSDAELEPKFDSNDQAIPPQIAPPGDQADDINSTVSLQLLANGGTAPLNWVSATGLPATMSMNSSGLISGKAPATTGIYTVTVTVQDDYDLINTATFDWTMNALPVAQDPGDPVTQGGVAISPVTLKATAGTGPFTWTATGLPSGLTLAASTGIISGTPNKVGAGNVVATVTDKNGNKSSVTFAWTVPPLTITTTLVNLTLTNNTTMANVTVAATGGVQNSSKQYGWTASGLPLGISINAATGVISGKPTLKGTYTVNVTAKDSQSPQNSAITNTVTWKVQ